MPIFIYLTNSMGKKVLVNINTIETIENCKTPNTTRMNSTVSFIRGREDYQESVAEIFAVIQSNTQGTEK